MPDTLLARSETNVDLRSIVARVKREIHRQRSIDEDAIKMEICSAIQHYAGHRFFFNEGNYTFYTIADQGEYGAESEIGLQDGYPADLLKPDIVRIDTTGGTVERYCPLERKTIQEIRDWQFSSQSSRPQMYAWHHMKMILWPAPQTADWPVQIDYVVDIGTPRYSHDGTSFSYEESVSGSTITDLWASPWFTHAEELIRARTLWGLQMNYYHDYSKAEAASLVEDKALMSLRSDTDNYNAPTDAATWGAGSVFA